MVKGETEWQSQSGIGNGYQVNFNRHVRMCYKSKAFLLRRLENSGTYSTGNLSLCLFFIKEENEKVFGILKSKNSK